MAKYDFMACKVTFVDWNYDPEEFYIYYYDSIASMIPIWRKCEDLIRIRVEEMLPDGTTNIVYWFHRDGGDDGYEYIGREIQGYVIPYSEENQ